MRRRRARTTAPRCSGCAAFDGHHLAQVQSTVADVYGWDGDGPRARIARSRTVEGFDGRERARARGRARRRADRVRDHAAPRRCSPCTARCAAAADAAGGKVFEAVGVGTVRRARPRTRPGSAGSTASRWSPTGTRCSGDDRVRRASPPTSCSFTDRSPRPRGGRPHVRGSRARVRGRGGGVRRPRRPRPRGRRVAGPRGPRRPARRAAPTRRLRASGRAASTELHPGA